jgi:hypothetical protein
MSSNPGFAEHISAILADHLHTEGRSGIRPIIGGFILLAEYTDETGAQSIVAVLDGTLPVWTEIGLLETQLTSAKQRWADTQASK